MATIPKVAVEVAFDGGPFSSSYSWTDISDYVKGFSVRRGRNNELDRIESGTLSLTLDNSDGRFTPGKKIRGKNAFAFYEGRTDQFSLEGYADNKRLYYLAVSVVDDQKPRVVNWTVSTNGKPVVCYIAIRWYNAANEVLRFVRGTSFVADSDPAVYTHEEAPPAGAVKAEAHLYADTYPEGNQGLILTATRAEWFQCQPYYPNVVPRRRVRVRTANLLGRDVSTGGDQSRSAAHFYVGSGFGNGVTKGWVEAGKSGAGAVQCNFASNGTTDYASSIACGYGNASIGRTYGMARVTPGQAYSTRSAVRLVEGSPDVNVRTRIRWYDANLAYVTASSSGPQAVLKTEPYNLTLNPSTEVDISNTFIYGSGATRTRVTSESYSGGACIEHAWTTDAAQCGTTWAIEPVSGTGTTIKFRFAIKLPATSGLFSNLQVAFRNSSGTVKLYGVPNPKLGEWAFVEATHTLLEGETVDRVGFSIKGTLGEKVYADAMMCQVTSGTLPDYADGDSDGFYWLGTPHASVTAKAPAWTTIQVLNQTAPANAAWAMVQIGSGTTGDNGASILIDEIQLEAGSTVGDWFPGGSIFHGYIEKWPVTTDGLTSSVEVTAVDGFSVLAGTDLGVPFQDQILTTSPMGYWPLGEPEGATRLENLANDQQPARFAASKFGAGTSRLGAESIVSKDSTTSWQLADIAANVGTVVDICEGGSRNYPLGFEFSVGFWCLPVRPSSGETATLFRSWADTAADHLKVSLDSSGKVTASMRFVEGISSITSTGAISTSKPTFIVVSVKDGYTSLWLNGSLNGKSDIGTVMNNDVRDMRWASLGGSQAGTIYSEYANGRYGHLAVWNRELSSTEILEIWKAGDYNGSDFTEGETARISRIAAMANYQGDTALDASRSTLQGPWWSSGTNALEELQGAAEAASGYLFMDGDGQLTYHNRDRRQGAPVRYVLGDSRGMPYEPGLSFEMDDDRIINEVFYSRPNGIEGVLKDAASIAAYGRKSKTIELRVTSDSTVQDAAYMLLNQYSKPVTRCDSVTLKATATPALFLVALGVEIGDRITLADLPEQAPESALDYYVEAVDTEVSVSGGTLEWQTTLSLSPAGNSDVWVLEDPTLGRLDRTTVLAY
ncbi:LamG-like jellyroll fold domain-containing protein [Streptomyces cellulosae]